MFQLLAQGFLVSFLRCDPDIIVQVVDTLAAPSLPPAIADFPVLAQHALSVVRPEILVQTRVFGRILGSHEGEVNEAELEKLQEATIPCSGDVVEINVGCKISSASNPSLDAAEELYCPLE